MEWDNLVKAVGEALPHVKAFDPSRRNNEFSSEKFGCVAINPEPVEINAASVKNVRAGKPGNV